MNEPVYILGGGRTDFKRNLKKEGKTIRDLITESGRTASKSFWMKDIDSFYLVGLSIRNPRIVE